MSDERMQVLEMLAAGKITAEQANQLIDALAEGAAFENEPPRPNVLTTHHHRPQTRNAGLAAGFTPDELIELSKAGVNARFVREMRDAGFQNVTADELIEMSKHGVSARFVREMHELGFSKLSSDELIELSKHGVDGKFVREMRALGFSQLSMDELIELRKHGVDAHFVEDIESVQLSREPSGR